MFKEKPLTCLVAIFICQHWSFGDGDHDQKVFFFLQAILGCLLFAETLSMSWWLGTSLILTGWTLVHYNSEPLTEEHLHLKTE